MIQKIDTQKRVILLLARVSRVTMCSHEGRVRRTMGCWRADCVVDNLKYYANKLDVDEDDKRDQMVCVIDNLHHS